MSESANGYRLRRVEVSAMCAMGERLWIGGASGACIVDLASLKAVPAEAVRCGRRVRCCRRVRCWRTLVRVGRGPLQ